MDSFSGKAAKEAKSYFSELHLTILESFRGLFDDLEENLQQHLNTFESEVDSSDSAVIRSNYLQDVKEEVNDVFADLEQQDESIADTIKDVSDISCATPPSFSDVNEWKKKAIKKLEELDEDLESFTGEGDETDVKAIIDKIETAMNNATTSKGKARFVDFEGAAGNSGLSKLKDYNKNKKEERKEKIENLSSESKEYLEQAKADYDNGNIDKATLEAITSGLINGENGFLKKLMKNKESNEVSNGEAKKILKWSNDHRELFVDSKTLLQEQKELGFKGEKGGYETQEMWNINLKLNKYKQDQAHAVQGEDDKALKEAKEKEKQLRNKYSELSEYLVKEDEPPQDLNKPLKLDNGEELNYRVDSNGNLHYKTEEGYEYYEETHKQSKGEYVQGVVAKTAASALATRGADKLTTKLPQWVKKAAPYAGASAGSGTELSGNSSKNPMYVSKPGEVKTMVYRTNKKTGEVENLIIDSQGNEVIKKRSWQEYN